MQDDSCPAKRAKAAFSLDSPLSLSAKLPRGEEQAISRVAETPPWEAAVRFGKKL